MKHNREQVYKDAVDAVKALDGNAFYISYMRYIDLMLYNAVDQELNIKIDDPNYERRKAYNQGRVALLREIQRDREIFLNKKKENLSHDRETVERRSRGESRDTKLKEFRV